MRSLLPRVFLAIAAASVALHAERVHAQQPPPPPPAALAPPSVLPPPPDPITVDVMARGGFAYRIGSSAGLPITGRVGGVGGLGVAVAPWSRAAIGLGWERVGIGSEHGNGDLADVEVSRSIDVIWASLRLYLVRASNVGLYVQLGPGLAIQHADASVLIKPDPGMQPDAYLCSESGGPGLALRAGLGVEARLAGPLWFTADAVVDHAHLSSDPLGSCAPGVGSLSTAGMRLGLSYRADVTRWLR
jgi:hypothetical protein